MSDYQVNDTVHLMFTTRQFSDGVPTALSGGVIDIYEDATATPIVTGETLVASLNSVVGLNVITITATSGTGFNADGTYNAVIQAGTVGGVSVIGEVVGTFTLEKDCVNWAKVAAPSTANDLSATDIQLCDTTTVNTDVTALNDIAATDIVTAGAIATLSGAVVNVDLCDLTTTTTTATNLTNNNDKTGYALSTAGVDLIWDETLAGHVTADTTGLLLNDWQDAGRLDAILDTIAADVVNIDGIVPSAAGDAMALTAGAVDDVWDEVLTGGTHAVPDSAGRRLRDLQEFGTYEDGAIWIDTVNGATGTTDFESGTYINPVDSISDANTLATSVGLSRFKVAPLSSITFAASQENQQFDGKNWDLNLGSRSVSNSHITGADVTGTGTSAVEVHFDHCEMGTCTLGAAHLDDCDISATVTLSAATDYFFMNCNHAGGTATIDFGSGVLNTTVHVHNFKGALTVENMGQMGTDVLHFDSSGGSLTLAASCVGGTVNMNGTFNFTNSGSGLTINDAGAIVETIGTPVGVDISADIADIPTVSEFNARTILSASYFDPVADAVANVTLVATTTDVTNDVGITSTAVDNIMDEVFEGTTTLRQFLRLSASSLYGKLNGAATTTVNIRDEADTINRIVATVDADGNRSAITLNKT